MVRRFLQDFFAQNQFWLLEREERQFAFSNHTGGEMRVTHANIAWTVLLILGLALAPASALAQKSKAPSTEKVNINTGTIEQLQTLPGIGPSTAKKIIELRTKNGKFSKIEEILNVKGIGEKQFQKMKDRLIV
jgi:comEA protein